VTQMSGVYGLFADSENGWLQIDGLIAAGIAADRQVVTAQSRFGQLDVVKIVAAN
jgi:hypothetical protein